MFYNVEEVTPISLDTMKMYYFDNSVNNLFTLQVTNVVEDADSEEEGD